MSDRKPWRLRDRALGPYMERRRPTPHAADRLLSFMAAPIIARFSAGSLGLARRVAGVESFSDEVAALSDDGLRDAAQALRPRFSAEGLSPTLVAQCFALTREASHRHLGKRHYPVQLMGAWALLDGMLAEMATGEGKTITAALAAATASLAGMPVHVITVNDYLASRDAEELGPVYRALGLSVGCVMQPDGEDLRRAAYGADITYVTSKELGFDYLRDRLALQQRRSRGNLALDRLFDGSASKLRLTGLGFAIVDEADSILIDEARTPLIIAARDDAAQSIDHAKALQMAASLRPGEHYELLIDRRAAELTDRGREFLATITASFGGVWRYRRAREEIARQALAALHLYERDHQYIVRDGKVEIVDEYTGRVAEGRKWEHGLHQMIEAKEQAELSPRDQTSARITYQSLFRRYARLAGMSGTAAEHRSELWAVYGLRTVRIPTHRPVRRRCTGRILYPDAGSRWEAVAEAAARTAAAGRPVLVGTRSVAASERISRCLADRGLLHTVLNAHQDRDEAEIVALAGQPQRITVATNMAGRGTDIRLADGIAELGGLHVILTEYHESRRIDRQLIGRGARQGDPGSWEAIVCADDALFTLHVPWLVRLLRVWGHSEMRMKPNLLRVVAQLVAERKYVRDRRSVLRVERNAAKQLAFVGGVE
jgi:preprotein translocase subunit SecA